MSKARIVTEKGVWGVTLSNGSYFPTWASSALDAERYIRRNYLPRGVQIVPPTTHIVNGRWEDTIQYQEKTQK